MLKDYTCQWGTLFFKIHKNCKKFKVRVHRFLLYETVIREALKKKIQGKFSHRFLIFSQISKYNFTSFLK